MRATQLAIEAAANVIHEGVQNKLLDYSIKGPEALRPIASSSLSDPRAVLLPTSPEFVGPLVERIHANAQTEEGRRQVSRNTVRQLSQARWDMPTSEGRQREFFNLLIPKLDDPTSDTQWFLAEQLGRILAANPDFRTPTLLSMVPKTFSSPLEESFWLPSAGWMLTYDAPLPEVGQSAAADSATSCTASPSTCITRNLDPERRSPRSRTVAVSMLYQPALYSSPEVIAAASRIDAGNFRRLLPEAFERDLRQAVSDDAAEPKLELTDRRRRNFAYFRDFVMPELARENRGRRQLVLLVPRRRQGSFDVARSARPAHALSFAARHLDELPHAPGADRPSRCRKQQSPAQAAQHSDGEGRRPPGRHALQAGRSRLRDPETLGLRRVAAEVIRSSAGAQVGGRFFDFSS